MADLASSVIYGYLQVNDSITANNLITAPKLTLTQATGTAPLTITSTTLVSNLNADLLDGKHASDFSLGDHDHTLDSLSNVTITSNATGEILKWNGTAWINNTLAEAGISETSHTHTGFLTTDDVVDSVTSTVINKPAAPNSVRTVYNALIGTGLGASTVPFGPADANTLVAPGFWSGVGVSAVNWGIAAYGFMIVSRRSAQVFQLAVNHIANQMQLRFSNDTGATWGSWQSVSFDGHTHGGGDITSAVANATTAESCSGNAATATKLATARTISLTGDVTGSVSFDGSDNASITATVAYGFAASMFEYDSNGDVMPTPQSV